MNNSLFDLFRFEFLIQYRKYNLIKFLVSYFIIFIIAACLINIESNITKIAMVFSAIYFPLSLMGFSNFILKSDIEDGFLEYLFTCFSALQIVFVKFFVYLIASIISLIFIIPIIIYLFQVSESSLIISITCSFILLIILSNSLLIFIGALQCYFRSNTNFLSSCILLLILPSLIITGMALQLNDNFYLLSILLGINLILVPILLILSSFLLKNVYHIEN